MDIIGKVRNISASPRGFRYSSVSPRGFHCSSVSPRGLHCFFIAIFMIYFSFLYGQGTELKYEVLIDKNVKLHFPQFTVTKTQPARGLRYYEITPGFSLNSASNGLSLSGSTVQLGGPLVKNTSITASGFYFDYIGSQVTSRITSTGNIGIGTTSPISEIHVQNTATTYPNLSYFKSLNGNGGYALRGESVNAGAALGVFGEIAVFDGTRWSGIRGNSGISTAPAVSGVSTVVNGVSGYFNERVGIGTPSPNSDLQIVGSVSETVRVVTATTVLNENDHKIVVNAGATNITLTLPPPLTVLGRTYVISRYASSTGSITLVTTSGQIQAFAGTVGATTSLGLHNAAGAGLMHSFTAVSVGGVGVWVRI